MNEGVSIIIPTWNGGEIFKQSLKALSEQKYDGEKQLIVIDSGSTDGTCEAAIEAGAELIKIDQRDFHHSRTRNEAVTITKHDKVVFLVQDAIPISDKWLSDLIYSIANNDIAAAYGRQVPHTDADLYARFEIEYHSAYLGQESMIQAIDSLDEFTELPYDEALRRVRFDNVCAIYKREQLTKTPFPDVPFGEDMAWAFEVMKKGYKVMYQPTVKVHHSHNRTQEYRFRRSIIDTIICSELLGKVRSDLSFMGVEDLYKTTLQIKEIVNEIYLEIDQKYGRNKRTMFSRNLLGVVSRLPLVRRTFWALQTTFRKGPFHKALDYGMKQSFENHLRCVIGMIVDKYPGATVEELFAVVDQVTSSMQGRLLGEVYVSHKLKGSVPLKIEEMILPYIWGV